MYFTELDSTQLKNLYGVSGNGQSGFQSSSGGASGIDLRLNGSGNSGVGDGFNSSMTDEEKQLYNENMQKGEAAKSKANASKSEAETSKAGAEKLSGEAEENEAAVRSQYTELSQNCSSSIDQILANNQTISDLETENDDLTKETEDIYAEIEELMAEDGEEYDAPEVSAPIIDEPADNGQQDGQGGQQSVLWGGQNNQNVFAMNSIPSGNYAPTSETGIAATRSQNAQGNQGAQPKRTASAAGAKKNLPAAKGKNADKINSLLAKANANESKMTVNGKTISGLQNNTQSLFRASTLMLNKAQSFATDVKGASESGIQEANGVQKVGQTTTTVGQATTAVGVAMQAFVYTAAAGKVVERVGTVTTTVGQATTSAGQIAADKNGSALNTATQSLSSIADFSSKLKSAKSAG